MWMLLCERDSTIILDMLGTGKISIRMLDLRSHKHHTSGQVAYRNHIRLLDVLLDKHNASLHVSSRKTQDFICEVFFKKHFWICFRPHHCLVWNTHKHIQIKNEPLQHRKKFLWTSTKRSSIHMVFCQELMKCCWKSAKMEVGFRLMQHFRQLF